MQGLGPMCEQQAFDHCSACCMPDPLACMQVVTSRMRNISSQVQTPMRIVGLCTSLANARDVGEWIGASSHAIFNFPPGPAPHHVPHVHACINAM